MSTQSMDNLEKMRLANLRRGKGGGARRRVAEKRPLRMKTVEPLAPWHPAKQRLLIDEIAPFLKKMYNIQVLPREVRDWLTNGVDDPREGGKGKKVYLRAHKFLGFWVVHKQDLIKFCELA